MYNEQLLVPAVRMLAFTSKVMFWPLPPVLYAVPLDGLTRVTVMSWLEEEPLLTIVWIVLLSPHAL